jgi:Tol biopolymer transport system component
MDNGRYDYIVDVSFSPDGKKILFNRRNDEKIFMIHVYDLESGELIAYQSPVGEEWFQARYSFDGKHIVFITTPIMIVNENNVANSQITVEDIDNSQIAVMDTVGKNVRKITNTAGFKVYPSFSHSGRKIIFARADKIRKKGGRTPVADYDVYEVDVETGRENRLTQFKFYQISNPYYFPDDKTFIFWGDTPFSYTGTFTGILPAATEKMCKELKSKYKKNSIYVMQGSEKELKPYLVMSDYGKKFKSYDKSDEYSRLPSLSADGSVLVFAAQGYKPDGSGDWEQIFQYSSDGNHRRITHLDAKPIWDVSVSPKGDLIAVIHNDATSQKINNIVIYRVSDGSIYKEITLPDHPSRIINN